MWRFEELGSAAASAACRLEDLAAASKLGESAVRRFEDLASAAAWKPKSSAVVCRIEEPAAA